MIATAPATSGTYWKPRATAASLPMPSDENSASVPAKSIERSRNSDRPWGEPDGV